MTVYEILMEISEENCWFGTLVDFRYECEEHGLEVEELNEEYAVVCDEYGDEECIVYFGGTASTITIKRIVEA